MEFDKSAIAVSSEYFIKIVFSVTVQSLSYSVIRTGNKAHPYGTPVEMDRSPDDTPLRRTYCFVWHKKFIMQIANFGLIFYLISILDK